MDWLRFMQQQQDHLVFQLMLNRCQPARILQPDLEEEVPAVTNEQQTEEDPSGHLTSNDPEVIKFMKLAHNEFLAICFQKVLHQLKAKNC